MPSKSLKVLYVDDDPDLRKIAQMSLALKGGLLVEVRASGEEALELVQKWQPDIILLDVIMPDMSGPQTMTRLRKLPETKEVPVVFMTSKTQPQDLRVYESLGAAGIIKKPFSPLTLSERVRELWENSKKQ